MVNGVIIHSAIMFEMRVGSFDFGTRNSTLGISILPFGAVVVVSKQPHSLYNAIIRGTNVFIMTFDVITSIILQKKETLVSAFLLANAVVAFTVFVLPAAIIFCIHTGILFGLLPFV